MTFIKKIQVILYIQVILGSPHTAGQMGTKSKWDESQNTANGDENGK